jgi:hypothetical protein
MNQTTGNLALMRLILFFRLGARERASVQLGGIGELLHFRQLFVIARNSSFTYRGSAVDVKQVGRELGVRYVPEGSVRKAANRMRATGQLIDVLTGAHLWADRFEGDLSDIFDLQDQVTTSVVGAIAPKLDQVEIERAKRKPTESLDAYDCYMQGMAKFYLWTREGSREALRLFYRAIELDLDFAAAHGLAARCYVWRKSNGWGASSEQETNEAVRLAQRAIELGKDDAVALGCGGWTLSVVSGSLPRAMHSVRDWRRRSRQWHACASSILRSAFPILRIASPFTGQKTSLDWPKVFGLPVFQSDQHQPLGRDMAPSYPVQSGHICCGAE